MENKSAIDVVADIIKQNKNFIFEKGKELKERELIKSTMAFEEYYKTTMDKYSRIKNIINDAQPASIYSIYVPIDLQCGDKIVSTNSLKNILKVDRNIIISGVGGSGKSTLLKYLFMDTFGYIEYIPIFIELKNINSFYDSIATEEAEEYFVNYIYKSMKKMNFNLEKKSLIYALKNAPIVLFLDGFDEVDDKVEEALSRGIEEVSIKYANLKIIMTSRQLEEGFISWSNFTEMKMKSLSKEQSIEVIKKIKYDNDVKEKFLEELEGYLYDTHNSFASNPLLLTIMLLTFREFAEIPEKMYLFYEEAFEVMFIKHDASKDGQLKRRLKSKLSKDDFKRVLSCFAWIGYMNKKKLEYNRKELMEYLTNCEKVTGIVFKEDYFIKDLTTSVCVLNLDGRMYTYSHRSFQEYFAAVFILNSTGEIQKKLLENLTTNSLRDSVLDLLFEMNQDVVEKQLIIPLLSEIYEKVGVNKENEINDDNFIEYCSFLYSKGRYNSNKVIFFVKRDVRKYSNILSFVRRYYLKKNRFFHTNKTHEEIQEFRTEELKHNEQLRQYILNKCIRKKEIFYETYEILDKLIIKHNSKMDIVEELLKMKN